MINRKKYTNGFTLIELVIVISILGILSFILFNILQGPAKAYYQTQQRVQLVDIVETALHRMTREIRLALPNSVRVNVAGDAIEFFRTRDGGRYRNQGANRLKFNKQFDTFEFLGPLNQFADIKIIGVDQTSCFAEDLVDEIDCMVVFNTGQTGANVYDGDNIAAITDKVGSTLDFNIDPKANFPFESSRQRFFIVDTPVSFICTLPNVTRYDNYTTAPAQPTPPGDGNANLLINQVTACNISYAPGTARRSGLVTISLTVTDPNFGQTITLMQQAHVDNQP